MAVDKLVAATLLDAAENGLVREDVLDSIMNANRDIDLELTSRVGSDTHTNSFSEWTIDAIDVASDIALIDGQDIDDNNSTIGVRVGNHTQTNGGRIVVSYEADESDTIGRASELGYQTSKYGLKLERSTQFSMYLNKPSVKGDGDATAGEAAGLEAQIGGEQFLPIQAVGGTGGWTTTLLGTANSTVQQVHSAGSITGGGLNNQGATTPGIIDAWDYTTDAATGGVLTETSIRNAIQARWNITGNKTTLVGLNRGPVNRLWSEYSFSSSARIATEISERTDGSLTPRTSEGAANIFLSDFGVVEFCPENIMPQAFAAGDCDTMFMVDPSYLKRSFMWSYRGERQGKGGLSEKWQLSAAWMLQCLDPQRQCMIQGIDVALPMTF
ncbi:MAG: DUF5309 domain-containing protein [Fuerstiella sp.]|nr:DUF5309 domain-containing protein [Fuerstiella sp.]